MTRAKKFQNGFAAVAAIFLVVVLAALGSYMLAFSNTQQITAAQDLQGSRAYWAARAGLEWGVSLGKSTSACPVAAAPASIDGFNMSVSCASTSYNDGGNVTILRFTSTATMGSVGSPGYVERSVSASLEL